MTSAPDPHEPAASGRGLFDAMAEGVPALRYDLDEWTRRMVDWHFSAETGSPFWLARAQRLPFDPVREITDFASLRRFGLFDIAELRAARVRDLLPRGFHGRAFRVVETGGTTAAPCRVVDVTRARYDVYMYRVMLRERGLDGEDVLAMTPGGPHAYGHFVSRLARDWAGAAYLIDFDPRWVKRCVRANGSRSRQVDEYVSHLVEQTEALLRAERPGLLFTTSRLLLALAAQLPRPLADYGVRAVCTGGTSCSAEEVRYLREAHLGPVTWVDTYGNTLVGHALQADRDEPGLRHSYHLPPPLAVIRVVRPDDPWHDVEIGERGRVLATTLLEDLFIPNLLERDSAIRVGPHPWFPCDGVARVRPYQGGLGDHNATGNAAVEVTEGVY